MDSRDCGQKLLGVDDLLATIARLTAERDALVEALRPFAEAAHVHKNEPGNAAILIPCTVGDLRRARALLALHKDTSHD